MGVPFTNCRYSGADISNVMVFFRAHAAHLQETSVGLLLRGVGAGGQEKTRYRIATSTPPSDQP